MLACTCQNLPATSTWCRDLPKAELHAHLSGSIRNHTIHRLLTRPSNAHILPRANGLLDPNTGRTLKQCFDLFPIIHDLITDPATLHELVLEVLVDFANDNVVYLELRTTPRASKLFTESVYLTTVLEAVNDFHMQNSEGMVCRVLISVSRHLSLEAATDAMRMTQEVIRNMVGTTMEGLIVGVELSGNPMKGEWRDFEPVLARVRDNLKLPVTLHFGEVMNEEEAMAMLDFKPERIGHAVVMSEKVADRLMKEERRLGVEVCITSNLITKSVTSLKEHPVVTRLIPSGHPFCLCTDDSGIFETSLSQEYGRLVEELTLTRSQIVKMAYDGLNLMFCRDEPILRRVHQLFHSILKNWRCGPDCHLGISLEYPVT